MDNHHVKSITVVRIDLEQERLHQQTRGKLTGRKKEQTNTEEQREPETRQGASKVVKHDQLSQGTVPKTICLLNEP